LKPAIPGGASTRTGRSTSITYDDLKENLVGGILKIIGKEYDPSEGKAWHGLVIKATNAGRSRDEMVEAVYSWYRALKVDGEPQNRAAALNRHFCKTLGLT